jgi:formyl-CoA transferase
MSGALSKFKVVDLTQARAGPACVRILSDMGAEVIQVIRPRDENSDSTFSGSDNSNLHRNKRSIGIDLQKEEGRQVFLRLIEDADVVVENFRADVKRRLRIDYETLSQINPRLVYGSNSGFGQDGPYGPRPGVDQIAQGLGGIMSVTGPPGTGPWRVGIAVCDMAAGMFLAHAILGALLEREESGKGQWVHTSLLEAAIAMQDFQAMRWLSNHEIPEQVGNEHPVGFPTGVFETSDGLINLSAGSDHQLRAFLTELGLAHLLEDERFKDRATRRRNRRQLIEECSAKIRERESEDLIEKLNQAGVPAGPVLTMDKVFADPQVVHLGMAQEIESRHFGKVPLLRSPFSLTRTPTSLRMPSPQPGEHTSEILQEHGFTEAEIDELKSRGVISAGS